MPGKTVSAKVLLSVSAQSTVEVCLSDGIDQDSVSKTGNGEFEFDLQLNVNETAAKLILSIASATPHVKIYIREACANVGKVVIKTLPCMVQGVIGQRFQYVATETAPAEELSLCAPPTELSADYTRLDSVLNQRFGKGGNNRSLLPDMRGYFSRSWDNGAAVDPDAKERKALGGNLTGDHVGTKEEDVFLKHKHELKFSRDKSILTGTMGAAIVIDPTKTSFTEDEGGKETRPKNIAELYTIKWA